MGRPSISEQRRMEIGRALQACMVRNGSYESTSVKDIAQEAGVATGLIHHYFANKDEILFLMADSVLLELSNFLEELLQARCREVRRQMLRELLTDEKRNRFILMLYPLALSIPEIRQLVLDHRRELEETLTLRLCKCGVLPEDAEMAAYHIIFLLESAVSCSALENVPRLEDLLFDALEKTFPLPKETVVEKSKSLVV